MKHLRLLEQWLLSAQDESEQLMGLADGIDEVDLFPFQATVLDHPVEVRAIEFAGSERRGLVAHTDRGQVSLFDVIFTNPEVVDCLNAYRAWADVEVLEARRPRGKATGESGTADLIVLGVRETNARCWDLSTGTEVTYKGIGLRSRAPGQRVTIQVNKRWTHGRWPYVSGKVLKHELDVDALNLDALPLLDRGADAKGKPRYEFKAVTVTVKGISNVEEELEHLLLTSRLGEAEELAMDGLILDLRWIAGHVTLGVAARGSLLTPATQFFEVGVAIGRLSLGNDFRGTLPFSLPGNRPFLSALKEFASAKLQGGDTEGANQLLDELLKLDPEDGLGAAADLAKTTPGETTHGS